MPDNALLASFKKKHKAELIQALKLLKDLESTLEGEELKEYQASRVVISKTVGVLA
jgi:hypothetical protein